MQVLLHRTAIVALCSVILLVFVGAIVRATGSGLGCPDWPTCWGCLIPPTRAAQIDVAKLDLERFRAHAARKGINPDEITEEKILEQFNPTHTWIEYINRLTSLPLGFSTLLLFFLSFKARHRRGLVVALAGFSLADVLLNGWMGAMVVKSGLKPGIITLHMALAFLLICVLVTVVWLTRRGAEEPPKTRMSRPVFVVSLLFFLCLFAEGILGSQVRELTDELGKAAGEAPRSEWIAPLSEAGVYVIHRSFSWSLLALALGLVFLLRQRVPFLVWAILAIVLAMMAMGIVLAHVGVFRVVQVLHVGLTSILLALTWRWLLQVFAKPGAAT